MNKKGQIRTLYAVVIAVIVTGFVVGIATYYMAVPAKPTPPAPEKPAPEKPAPEKPAPEKPAPKKIKIGTNLSVTGDLAPLGIATERSTKLAVDLINKHGGVLGKRLELVTGDTESKAVAGAETMVRLCTVEKVPAVVGCISSGVSFAALKVAIDEDVVQISPGSTSPKFTEWGRKNKDEGWFWRTVPSDALQGAVMAKLAWDEGYRTANTLVVNNPYGVGFGNTFAETYEKLGGEVLHKVKYDPAGKVFGATVESAAEDKPDLIMLVGYPMTGSIILSTAYRKGVMEYSDWLLSEGMHEEDFPEKVGKNPEGKFLIEGIKGTAPMIKGPGYKKYRTMFKERFKVEPDIWGPQGFDAVMLIALAMEKAGGASSNAIKKNLRAVSSPPGVKVTDVGEALKLVREGKEINYEGVGGAVNFDEVGDVVSDYAIWQVTPEGSMKVVKVYTAEEIAEIGK